MFKLTKYLKGYIKESIIGPLFKLLEACFELIVPLVMAKIIDVGIRNHDIGYVLRMGGIMVFLGLLGLVCSLTAQYFAAKAALGFGTALRNDMYSHINKLSFSEIDQIGTSSLITRLTSDINQAQSGVNLVLRLFLRSPFIVVGAIIMALYIQVNLTLIFLIVTVIISIIVYLIMSHSIPHYKQAQQKLDNVSLITRENLTGVRVIRAFSRQQDEITRYDAATSDLMGTQLFVGKISALLNPATYAILNAGIIALLWFGGITVYEGIITQGEVMALINYMSQILLALLALANLIIAFTRASASAIRINEVFAVTPSMTEGTLINPQTIENTPKIVFKNVSFAYHQSDKAVINDVSFTVQSGETIGIIGGTGAGKSTLVNLVPRFYDVTDGEILIDGINVKEYTSSELRKKISIVPQKAVLFRETIRENMKWGNPDATDEEIVKALMIAQAKSFVDSKPNGLDTEILQGGKNLSGGQKQRLTIARALVVQPEILILDDSASALDYATDARLRKALATETKDMTVLIVSQRVSAIRNADKIIVLDQGRMVGIGKHEELIKTCDIYKEICLSQLSENEVKGK